MLTYAIDDKNSFQTLEMWKNEFFRYADIKEMGQFPFIVVGNKSDVPQQEREVSELEMENWCRENSISAFIETSAKNASNVQEAFNIAVRHWIRFETKADRNDPLYQDTIDLTKKQTNHKSACCSNNNAAQN